LVFVSVTTDGFWKQLNNKHAQKGWERVQERALSWYFWYSQSKTSTEKEAV